MDGKIIKGYCHPIDPEEQKLWEAAEIKLGDGVTDFFGAEDQPKPLGDGAYPTIIDDRKMLKYYYDGAAKVNPRDDPDKEPGYTFHPGPARGIIDVDAAAHYQWRQGFLERDAVWAAQSSMNNWFNLRLIFSSLCCLAATLQRWWNEWTTDNLAESKYLFLYSTCLQRTRLARPSWTTPSLGSS